MNPMKFLAAGARLAPPKPAHSQMAAERTGRLVRLAPRSDGNYGLPGWANNHLPEGTP